MGYGGIPGGEENGKRGYFLTHTIAYIRDFLMNYGIFGESFETSVPWTRILSLCHNVRRRFEEQVERDPNVLSPVFSCRVTQGYDDCACVYFYIAITVPVNYEGDHSLLFDKFEHAAREEVIKSGGSISHHHGIGKVRQHWIRDAVSRPAINALKAVKRELDPSNVFACGNIYGKPDPEEPLMAKL